MGWSRVCALVLVMVGVVGAWGVALGADTERQLPGPEGQRVLLPNGWRLSPAGRQIPVADGALNFLLTPDGGRLAVLHCGSSKHSIHLVDPDSSQSERFPIDSSWSGMAWVGDTLFVTGGSTRLLRRFRYADDRLSALEPFRLGPAARSIALGGVAASTDGGTLYVTDLLANQVLEVDASSGEVKRRFTVTGRPYGLILAPDGRTLYVSCWLSGQVAALETESGRVLWRVSTGNHANEMALTADGATLFVANSGSNTVSVVSTREKRVLEQVNVSLAPSLELPGSTTNSLALRPDGLLAVANADSNAVALVDAAKPGSSVVLGFVPVGWYPAACRFSKDGRTLYVLNSKGAVSRANPKREQIKTLLSGTLSVLDVEETRRSLPDLTARAVGNLPAPLRGRPAPPLPKMDIRHILYVVKENRTYDQVFGDMKEGNGDPSLAIFGEEITPNHHALAREFVLLDNFYVDAEVSADGHNWSFAAYANDYVERTWPYSYGSHGHAYDYEGTNPLSRPPTGYIWDAFGRAGKTYRSYGTFTSLYDPNVDDDKPEQLSRPNVPSLEGHVAPKVIGWNLDVLDQVRVDQFLEEFREHERKGDLPNLMLFRLPNDHTSGTTPGKPTPRAMVADNDLALGRLVEALSHSKSWRHMAIFVVEDDAQNGPDHVDAHRSPCLVIGPYVRRRFVDHTLYTTSSVLRTMEMLQGVPPLNQFDAGATPMTRLFTDRPDYRPYRALPSNIPLDEKNPPRAPLADLSKTLDFSQEDRVPDEVLNRVLWAAMKGPDAPVPAPVRSAFPDRRPDSDD